MSEEKFTLFYKGHFSQWYPCNFEFNGSVYNSAEQYMMAGKARVFGDMSALFSIMNTKDPIKQKKIGRLIKNFDQALWDKHAFNIVLQGNKLKFEQNKPLMDELKKTVGTTLVECSPSDKIWGIGRSIKDPLCKHREHWLGSNLLGEAITQARIELLGE